VKFSDFEELGVVTENKNNKFLIEPGNTLILLAVDDENNYRIIPFTNDSGEPVRSDRFGRERSRDDRVLWWSKKKSVIANIWHIVRPQGSY